MQIRNPNRLVDQYRRWWGFEGGSAGAATTWNVPPSHLLGFDTRPRLGEQGYLDVYLDMPQPLLCLSVSTPHTIPTRVAALSSTRVLLHSTAQPCCSLQ